MAFAEAYSPHQHPERFLDTYIYAGVGALESGGLSAASTRAFEKALTELGGSNFEFYIDPDRAHERLPVWFENTKTRLPEILLANQ